MRVDELVAIEMHDPVVRRPGAAKLAKRVVRVGDLTLLDGAGTGTAVADPPPVSRVAPDGGHRRVTNSDLPRPNVGIVEEEQHSIDARSELVAHEGRRLFRRDPEGRYGADGHGRATRGRGGRRASGGAA